MKKKSILLLSVFLLISLLVVSCGNSDVVPTDEETTAITDESAETDEPVEIVEPEEIDAFEESANENTEQNEKDKVFNFKANEAKHINVGEDLAPGNYKITSMNPVSVDILGGVNTDHKLKYNGGLNGYSQTYELDIPNEIVIELEKGDSIDFLDVIEGEQHTITFTPVTETSIASEETPEIEDSIDESEYKAFVYEMSESYGVVLPIIRKRLAEAGENIMLLGDETWMGLTIGYMMLLNTTSDDIINYDENKIPDSYNDFHEKLVIAAYKFKDSTTYFLEGLEYLDSDKIGASIKSRKEGETILDELMSAIKED